MAPRRDQSVSITKMRNRVFFYEEGLGGGRPAPEGAVGISFLSTVVVVGGASVESQGEVGQWGRGSCEP